MDYKAKEIDIDGETIKLQVMINYKIAGWLDSICVVLL